MLKSVQENPVRKDILDILSRMNLDHILCWQNCAMIVQEFSRYTFLVRIAEPKNVITEMKNRVC